MKPKVFLSHPLPQERVAPLLEHCELIVGEPGGLNADNAPDVIAECVGLICILTDKVDTRLIDRMPKLQFVSSISVGVDHVDVAALTARAIPLGHTPGVLVDATADTAFALLLAAARRIAEGDRYIRAGKWRPDQPWSPDFFLGKDIAGATLGIVGLGAIGQAVAKRAAGFGVHVVAWNRSPRDVAGVAMLELDKLLAISDYVSVNLARTEETLGLLGAANIAKMKPGAILVNTARGGIVDESALCAALDTGHLFAAGLDVYEEEPLPQTSLLLNHPRVVLVPHIGSATTRTREAMVQRAVENAVEALAGDAMSYCFNKGQF